MNLDAFADRIVLSVKAHVARSIATVTKRQDDLEQRLAAIPAGEKGEPGARGEAGVKGDRGESVDPESLTKLANVLISKLLA